MQRVGSWVRPLSGWVLGLALVQCATAGRPGPSQVDDADEEDTDPPRPEDAADEGAALFDEAVAAQQADRLDGAIAAYRSLLEEHPESGYVLAGRYNLGLAHEAKGELAAAARQYEAIVQAAAGTRTARDARFRLATCQRQLGRPEDAERTLRELLAEPRLPVNVRHIARTRLAEVLVTLDRLDEAEREVRSVVVRSRPRPGREEVLAPGPILADALFVLARLHRIRLGRQPLRLPLKQMGQDLAAKVAAFKRAQAAYLRVMRIGVPAMTTAAGLELGEMYEELCRDLLDAPIPARLSAKEQRVYHELLEKELRPLVERTIEVYQRNLGAAGRLGVSDVWVESTKGRLQALHEALGAERSFEELRRVLGAEPAAPGD